MVKNVMNLIIKKDIHQLTKCGYEDAIEALNLLQSNASYLKNSTILGPTHSSSYNILECVKKYLLRTDLTLENLDKLSVIHVAGTKGKGSTCAYCESILREHGYRTGFFSSPHLIEVRERIRINGKPLEKDAFAKYFWPVFNKLQDKKENPTDMPLYFRFLTIMAFHVFLQENVDVAIIEVGIGGEYDCTNVLRNVQIAGITSLGIDHVSILGNTLEKIAWQKAGIMKRGAHVFTVPQPKEAMKVLQERSAEKQCTLNTVPPIESYKWNEQSCLNDTQKINIALAIQLSHSWMHLKNDTAIKTMGENQNTLIKIPAETLNGIKKCSWPGRLQIIEKGNFRFFLDGAHTTESLNNCIEWYTKKTKDSKSKKALLFYITGDRSYESLIQIAQKHLYSYVYFVPAVSTVNVNPDRKYNISSNEFNKKCAKQQENWLKLRSENKNKDEKTQVFLSVNEALQCLPADECLDILVTGSLHLVGTTLNLIDPQLSHGNTL